MAVGGSINFDASSIRQADEAIKKLVKNAETGIGKVNKAWKDMTKDGLNHFIQRINVAQRAMSKLSNARVNVRFSGQANDLKRLGDSASRAIPQVNKLITVMQQLSRLNINIVGSRGGGSPTAMDAQKIKYLQDQIKLLEKQLKLQQDISKALGNQVNNTNIATSSMSSLGDAARKLRQISGTIFSIRALMGYGNQLLKIRGEFEMQHRSLQVLLQDVDKANELWDKTIALAVKSPFRVKELVTYTKQLAAYRVESEKLYDTTRMLADVSAGLGIDMNRLILAFGQVKAANFLRGTELRQFSEAGVNMLEELSKRFTKLEGRAVSVGDVFERVSKRMVKFSDVEAVFQTITSEGGVFYQMQEKQSETLKGMIMNLKDSVDLMFNEIGIASDGLLKGAVRLVKELVDNWRKFVPVITAAGTAFLAGFSVKTIASIGRAFKALWAVISANPIAAAISIIAALVAGIISARKNINELTAALSQVDKEITSQLEESIGLYRKLADRVRDVTATEKDRNKAMEQLKSRFEEILPDQLLELEYISNISSNYREATDAMMNYYNAKATEQKRDRVESQFAEELEGIDIPELINSMRSIISSRVDIDDRIKPILLSGVSGVVNEVVQDIKSGALTNDMATISGELQKRLERYANVELPRNQTGEGIFWLHDVKDIIKTLDEYRTAIDNVMGLPFKTYAEKEAANIFLPEKENIEATKSSFQEIINLVDTYSQKALSEWTGLDEEFNALISKLPEEAVAYIPLLSSMFENMKIAASQGSFEFGKSIQGFQQDFLRGLSDTVWSQTSPSMASFIQDESGQWTMDIQKELIQLVTNAGETLGKEAERLNLNEFQKSVVGAMEIIAQKTGQSVDEFREFIPKMGDSLTSVRENVESEISLIESRITTWTNSMKVEAPELISARPGALGETQEEIDALTKLLEAFKMLRDFLGGAEKKKKGRTENTIEERIKVVDQMNAKYKELNKTLSKTDALEGAFEAYKDAFATAYGREDVRQMSAEDFAKKVLNFPNEDAVVKWLDDLAKTVADKEDKIKVQLAKGKFEMDVEVRLKKEADENLKKEIEDMFDQYDLSVELKKLNIPKDLAKSLFNVDYLDLEGLKKAVQDQKAKFIGTDMEDEYKKFLEKIDDLEDKQQLERLKKYVEYAKKGLSERAKIKLEELKKLQEIEETFKIEEGDSEETRQAKEATAESASKAVREESQKAMNKLEWEEFEKSDTFINIFDDIDNASTTLLNHMIGRLEEFKEQWKDMPLEDVNKIIEKLNLLQEKLAKAKPSEAAKKARDEIKAARGQIEMEGVEKIEFEDKEAKELAKKRGKGSFFAAMDEEQAYQDQQKAAAQEQISLLETALRIKEGTATASDKVLEEETKVKEMLKLSDDELKDQLKTQQGIVSNADKQNGKIQKARQNQKNLTSAQKAQYDAIKDSVDMANDLYSAFKELVEVLDADDPAMVFADMGMNILSSIPTMLTLIAQIHAATIAAEGLGMAMNMAMGIVGLIVMAIQLLVQAISAAVNYAEKMRQMKLDVLAGQVDNLKKKYDALAESIDKAYSTKQLQEYSKEIDKVQAKMEDAQRDYIKLLESGKDGDTIKIAKEAQRKLDAGLSVDSLSNKERKALLSEEYKDYKDATEALAEMQEDYEEQKQDLLDSMGGVTDYKSEAQEFVDAWVDAFQETGDGLSGLQENFREFFDNVIKQEAMRRVTDKYMEPFFDDLNAALESESSLSEEEIADLKAKADKVAPELSKVLEELWIALGGSKGEAGGLSALQKGISGMSEQQAEILSAYWNSVRGYTASIDSKMDLILANMGVGSENNPMLDQLIAQTSVLNNIYSFLKSMTTSSPRSSQFSGLVWKSSM